MRGQKCSLNGEGDLEKQYQRQPVLVFSMTRPNYDSEGDLERQYQHQPVLVLFSMTRPNYWKDLGKTWSILGCSLRMTDGFKS